MKTGLMVVFVIIAVLVGGLLLGGCLVYSGYNQAIALDEGVKSQWAQVENQLQRRYELIPNLVESVKGMTGQEQEIFLGIAKSREAYFNANSRSEKINAATGLESALSRLLVLRETYPELKSNESFMKLQDSLEGTENRLAVERMRYNESVKTLNTFRRKLMGRIYAGLAGVKEAEYFEISEEARAAPKVDFSEKASDN